MAPPACLPCSPIPGPLPSQDSQLCPSDGRSCATSICQTTLRRTGGEGAEKRRREGVERRASACLFCVLWGHHASVIFWAQLKLMSYSRVVGFFFCCCGATFTGKTHCPEAVMRLFAAPQPILIFNQFPQIKNSFHGYTLITEKCLNLSQSVEFILKMCRNFPQM